MAYWSLFNNSYPKKSNLSLENIEELGSIKLNESQNIKSPNLTPQIDENSVMKTNKTKKKSLTDLKYNALEAFITKNQDACDQNAEI